jgi:hypothetical protein
LRGHTTNTTGLAAVVVGVGVGRNKRAQHGAEQAVVVASRCGDGDCWCLLASGETDGPNKFSSGAWLLRASEEIDE